MDVSGLLVTDVSDHLPVFAEMDNKLNVGTHTQTCNFVRLKPPEAIMVLRADLMNHDWQEVYVDNINKSYDAFLDTFLLLYERLFTKT